MIRLFLATVAVSMALGLGTARPAPAAANDDEVIALVVDLLHEKDKELRSLGLDQVRKEVPGEAATLRFAAELPKLPAEGQIALVRALADRGDRAARLGIVRLLADSPDEAVRVTVVCALGSLGNAGDTTALVPLLGEASAPLRKAARHSLTRLAGDNVSALIAAELTPQPVAVRVELLEILVERKATETLPQIVPWAISSESALRRAAMSALGQLAGLPQLDGLLSGLLLSEPGAEREAAEKALAQAAGRWDEQARDNALLQAYAPLNAAEQAVVLPALGRIGGEAIFALVMAAIADADAVKAQAGLRALCNWPDAAVAGVLRERVATGDNDQRALVRAALIRVAPLPDRRNAAERLQATQQVYDLCQTDAERQLLVKRARAIRSVETLRWLLGFLDQPALAAAAAESVVELAHHRELRDKHKDEFHPALERIGKTAQDPVVVERAGRYLRNQTWAKPAPAKSGAAC